MTYSIGSFFPRSLPPFAVPGEPRTSPPELDRSEEAGTSSNVVPATDSLELSQAFRQQESLSVGTQIRIRQSDEGLTANVQVKLRYRYDFVADDGSRISVRLKARLNLTQSVNNGDSSQTQTQKLQVKASVRALQQEVAAVPGSLQESAQLPESVLNIVSEAIELFQQLTNGAENDFVESDAPDGDQLITRIVEAFNEFAGAVLSNVLPAADKQPALTEGDSVPVELPDVVTTEPATPAPPDVTVPLSLPVVQESTPEPAPTTDSDRVSRLRSESLDEASEADDDDSVDEVDELDDVNESDEADGSDASVFTGTVVEPKDAISVAPSLNTDPASLQESVRTTLFTLRLRVVQSLRHLAVRLEPGSIPTPESQPTYGVQQSFHATRSVSLFSTFG